MKDKLIKLERNFMFTDIFNQDKNVPKLEKFISIFFNFPYEKVHNNLKLLPRKLSKDNKKEAWKEVDLLLKLDNEMLKINIEINNDTTKNIIDRNVIYIAKISSTNYEEGDSKYENIWTSRQINFNVTDSKHNKLINEYVFKEVETNEVLTDIVQIDIINMSLIDKLCYNELNKKEQVVYNFCKMLNAENKDEFREVSELIMDEELSRDLLDQMTRKSREEEYVYMDSTYSSFEEYKEDVLREAIEDVQEKTRKEIEEKTRKEIEEKTRKEIEEKTRKEIEEKTRKEIEEKVTKEVEEVKLNTVNKMLEKNIDTKLISEITGISIEKIDKLKGE